MLGCSLGSFSLSWTHSFDLTCSFMYSLPPPRTFSSSLDDFNVLTSALAGSFMLLLVTAIYSEIRLKPLTTKL